MNKLLKDGRMLLIIIVIGILLFEVFFHQHGSVHKRIADKLQDYNSSFQGVLYSQFIDDDRILSFYRVGHHEFAFGLLEDNAFGLEVIRGSGNASLISDKNLTWHATDAPSLQLSLIYGAVLHPEITQVIVISEGSKAATIVEKAGVRFWFLKFDPPLSTPITIKATNQDGAVLYEYGVPEYWEENGGQS